LLAIECKRGLVWGELEFVLADNKVVRLHGTEWNETQRFYQHLNERWVAWSTEMSEVAAGVLSEQLADISGRMDQEKWLTRAQLKGVQQQLHKAFDALPVPTSRLESFANCRDLWRQCQAWLKDTEAGRAKHNQDWTDKMLVQYEAFLKTSKVLRSTRRRQGRWSMVKTRCWCSPGQAVEKPRCWWLAQAGCCCAAKHQRIRSCCWPLVEKPRKRWMSAFVSGCIRMTSLHVRFMRWRYTSSSRVEKSAGN
jgi:hypothetical protein